MWCAGNSTIYLFFFIKNSLTKICSPPWKSKPIPRERRTTRRSGNCLISQQVNFHNYLICHSASPPQPQTLTNTAPVFTNNKLRLRSAVPTTTHRTLLIFFSGRTSQKSKIKFRRPVPKIGKFSRFAEQTFDSAQYLLLFCHMGGLYTNHM